MSDTAAQTPAPIDSAAIRAALDQCLTLADIEHEMGWAAGTAARTRWRPEPSGLPEPDHFIGRTPVWFRDTFAAWRASRPGMGARSAQPERPRARDRRSVPTPPAGYQTATDGLTVPRGDDVDVIAYVHGSWRSVQVRAYNRRSLAVRYHLDDTPEPSEHTQRVGINYTATPAGPVTARTGRRTTFPGADSGGLPLAGGVTLLPR